MTEGQVAPIDLSYASLDGCAGCPEVCLTGKGWICHDGDRPDGCKYAASVREKLERNGLRAMSDRERLALAVHKAEHHVQRGRDAYRDACVLADANEAELRAARDALRQYDKEAESHAD